MNEIQKQELMNLVTQGTLKKVQASIKKNKLNIRDESFFDYDLLKAALNRNHQSIINFLLNYGCRINNPNIINYEDTPLHIAMKLNNIGTIKVLLKKGASLNDKNTNGETPILTGFQLGYYSAVNEVLNYFYLSNDKYMKTSMLVKFKVLDPKNKDDILHFHIACIINNVKVVKVYLKCGFDINSSLSVKTENFSGFNPLQYAAIKLNFEMFICLVKHDAGLSMENVDDRTALNIFYYSSQFKSIIQKTLNFKNDTLFINSKDNKGIFNFHLCCMKNSPELVETFIEQGVDVNSPVPFDCQFHPGFTALHFAVLYSCDKVVRLLLKNGANCNVVDIVGTTPLHLACASFYIHLAAVKSIIEMLLDYNASVTATDANGCTPLHKMFKNTGYRETKILDMLIAKVPRNVNYSDNEGLSHFHIICTRHNTGRVKDFLKAGVAVNHCVTALKHTHSIYNGYTPLHFAAMFNQKDILQILLKSNAQVNVQTKKMKSTPLHLACEFHYKKVENIYNEYKCAISNNRIININWTLNRTHQLEIIKLLLLHGADIEAKDLQGSTALLRTCSINFQDFPIFLTDDWPFIKNVLLKEICFRTKSIFEILLFRRANINARTKNQKSVLHLICENPFLQSSKELIEFLIVKGADVNAVDGKGFTPLHIAVYTKNLTAIKSLLKYKANVNATTKNATPLEIIIRNYEKNSHKDRDIMMILLSHGSKVNIRTSNGTMILHEAIKNQDRIVVEMLLHFGADINIEDSHGNCTGFFLLNNWTDEKIQSLWQNNIKFAIIFEIVFIHVQKLLALGFHVNKNVQSICSKLRKYYNIARQKNSNALDLDSIYHKCVVELSSMKYIKVDNYTLYSILTKDINELSNLITNKTSTSLKNYNFCEEFPLYGYLLNIQFKKLFRSKLLKAAKTSLSSVVDLNLPNHSSNLSLKNLTNNNNNDIVNLQTATPVIHSIKRKINSNFNYVRLPPKVQRTK